MIRALGRGDGARLADFLKGLPDEVYDSWNRFGFSATDYDTKAAARRQCRAPRAEEVGFVAVDSGGRIIGYSYLRFFPGKENKRHNASLGIVVAAGHHGRGIGKRLMLHMHRWARRHGIKKIWLATYARNSRALRLYLGLGYEVEGIFMYDERGRRGWDHVVSMALMLDRSFCRARTERRALTARIDRGASVR